MDKKHIKELILVGSVCVAIIILVIGGYYVYNRINKNAQQESIIKNSEVTQNDDFEEASIQIGKTIEEMQNITNNEVSNNINSTTNSTVNETKNTSINNTTTNTNKKKEVVTKTNSNVVEEKESSKEEKNETEENTENSEDQVVEFKAPVKGTILREFANSSLVYSDTLQEWVTHNGVDIKADKTTVVTASAKGTVDAIKNDPRYGLTVIINHANGYQTIYSNLLTAEFVVEGEEVECGQTIGTVGNTASFEISDEYHLHFELLQNSQYLDPAIYMQFE